MRIFQNTSIRRKQTLIIMLTSTVVLLLACAAFVTYDLVTFRRELVGNVSTTANVIGNNCTVALDFNDPKSAGETVASLSGEPNIVAACIYDQRGDLFAFYRRDGTNAMGALPLVQSAGHEFAGKELQLYQTIIVRGEMMGTIYLAHDLRQLDQRMKRYAGIVALVLVASFLVAFGLSSRLQRMVSNPILHLAQVSRSVAVDKNYSVRAIKQSEDELGQLIDGFNEMLGQIQERDAALQAARDNLEHRVEERTKELAESLSLFNATLESTTDAIVALDLTGKVTSLNAKFTDLWQFPAELLERRDTAEMVAYSSRQVKDPEKLLQQIKQSQSDPEAEIFHLIEFKDGRILERHSLPQRIDNKCVGVVVNWRDITQRTRAEEALRESQALYLSLVDQMPASIFRKNAEGRYVFVNSLFCQVMEMSADQILGKTSSELVACISATQATRRPVSEELGTQGMSHHESIMQTGRPILVEDEYQGSDGKRSCYHTVKSPVFGPDGKIVGTQGMLFDITERKQAEAELAYERDLLRALLDNSPDEIYFKDAQSRFLKSSKGLAEKFGLKDADGLIGKTDFDFFSEEHARPAFEDEQEIIRTGHSLVGRMEKEVWNDGRVSWVITHKMPLRNKDGQIIGTFGISRDITAIKAADEARRQSDQLLQAMFDNSPDRIYFKDTQSRFLKLGRMHARRLGLADPELAVGKTDFDFQPPEQAKEFFDDEQRILQTGEPLINKTQKQILPNGEVVWTSTTKAPLRDPEGKVFGLVGINRDITEQKQAEELLRHQNVYLTALQETTLDVISQLDLDRLLENLVKRAGQLMGTSTGFLDLLEPGEDHLTPKIAFGALAEESLKFAVKLGEGLGGKVWQTGQPMLIEDYDAWPGRIKSHKGNLIQSIIEVPLMSKSGFVGVLGLAHEKGTNRTFGPEAIERLSQFARFATIAIENARLYSTIQWELTERKRTEAKLEQVHKQLLETSRLAGMAEVASNVLHNVGNVLNSVNVSASLVVDSVKKSKAAGLSKVVALMREHEHDLGTFITSDSRGKQLPTYLAQLSEHLLADQKTTVQELDSLLKNVEHIKEIVAVQQSYARVSGVKEIINVRELVEDGLRMNVGALGRHGVEIVREFEEVPLINIDRHKVLQVLVNLIRNAKHACQESSRVDRRLTVRVVNGAGRIKLSVIDNGIGIPPENLTRIFSHGFTTRKDGHGFGLHSGALAAREMGGSLTVHSDGPGLGATFILELPLPPYARPTDGGRHTPEAMLIS